MSPTTPLSEVEDPFAFIDWTAGSNDGNVTKAGLKLELKTYDVRENSKGDKVVLQTGKKVEFPKKLEKDHQSAMVVTKTYDKEKLTKTEVVIRSPYIKAALKETIVHYPGLDLDAEKVTLTDSPKCLFHYRKELQAYGRRLQDQTAKDHLVFALNYMRTAFISDIPHYTGGMANRNPGPGLDFDRLWMAYRPGDLIFVKSKGESSVGRLVSMTPAGLFWRIWVVKIERVVCNGGRLEYSTFELSISSYSGLKHFQDLKIFPLQYHPEYQSVRKAMVERGKKLFALRGVHQRYYQGNARWASDPPPGKAEYYEDDHPFVKFQVKSRIMIDPEAFTEARPEHFTHDTYTKSKTGTNAADQESDEQYLICHNEVFGYSITDKRWCAFNLDKVEEIDFCSTAFESLLLPQEQKDTILSLVRVHTDESLQFHDLVRGKGKGMIFLLHGVPGVGKTLTAESISDYVQRPLFPIRSGDLGIDAPSLEKNLNESFEMAAKWNAIILLDEADVFLEARRRNELLRNSLVSVFLRVLEYYEGIMFLTTNRIETFDPAFKSRIHLSIRYQSLSQDFRRRLWYNFIESGASSIRDPSAIQDDLLHELASHDLNGRQIRNIVRTAYALAISAGERLNARHIRTTLAATNVFEDEMASSDDLLEEDIGTPGPNSRKRRRLE